MAQMTGTTILALARVFAQDTATSSPAVGDTNALLLLNDVLLRYTGDVESRDTIVAASTSGLTFAANEVVKETGAQDLYDHILSAHPSDTNAANTVLTPALTLWTVEEMLAAHRDEGDGSVSGSGTREWQAYAWERVAAATAITGSTALRVYVWPALGATRHLTIRVPKSVLLAALTDTPDLSQREARIVARLLAWEMARLHSRDEAFLQQILAPMPSKVLDAYMDSAKTHGWMQSAIRETGALDG